MERRDFVKAGAAAAGVTWAGRPTPVGHGPAQARQRAFKLHYAPHFGMFKEHAGDDLVSQIDFMADQGFTAFEDNGMSGRSVSDQDRIAGALQRHEMHMGVFVAHTIGWRESNLASGDLEKRDLFVQEVRAAVDVAKRVNATWMTVVPGRVDSRLEQSYQTANVIDALRQAAEVLEPHGLVMVLEPLNTLRDHPGQFLTRVPQAFELCRAVNSPACKILFDMYHQQVTEGNLIPNIDMAWGEIAYFQIGDHPGRNEPTTGEINYRNVFQHIHAKEYTGILGMEHGNSRPGRAGERAVIDAYVASDDF
jgi:hydroxypyruvate isomerase